MTQLPQILDDVREGFAHRARQLREIAGVDDGSQLVRGERIIAAGEQSRIQHRLDKRARLGCRRFDADDLPPRFGAMDISVGYRDTLDTCISRQLRDFRHMFGWNRGPYLVHDDVLSLP